MPGLVWTSSNLAFKEPLKLSPLQTTEETGSPPFDWHLSPGMQQVDPSSLDFFGHQPAVMIRPQSCGEMRKHAWEGCDERKEMVTMITDLTQNLS